MGESMKAKCMKAVDIGDGVTFFCGKDFGHDDHCGPGDIPSPMSRCGWTPDEVFCLRAKGHEGPHKDGTERPMAEP